MELGEGWGNMEGSQVPGKGQVLQGGPGRGVRSQAGAPCLSLGSQCGVPSAQEPTGSTNPAWSKDQRGPSGAGRRSLDVSLTHRAIKPQEEK